MKRWLKTWTAHALTLPNGTEARRAGHGIANTAKKGSKPCRSVNTLAGIVGKSIWPCLLGPFTSIAATRAKPLQGLNPALTTKGGSARPVEKSSLQTNMQKQSAVPEAARLDFVPVKAVRSAGREPTYNMEVDGFHNFSVNDGIVVHNCVDALRYVISTTIPHWRFGEV